MAERIKGLMMMIDVLLPLILVAIFAAVAAGLAAQIRDELAGLALVKSELEDELEAFRSTLARDIKDVEKDIETAWKATGIGRLHERYDELVVKYECEQQASRSKASAGPVTAQRPSSAGHDFPGWPVLSAPRFISVRHCRHTDFECWKDELARAESARESVANALQQTRKDLSAMKSDLERTKAKLVAALAQQSALRQNTLCAAVEVVQREVLEPLTAPFAHIKANLLKLQVLFPRMYSGLRIGLGHALAAQRALTDVLYFAFLTVVAWVSWFVGYRLFKRRSDLMRGWKLLANGVDDR